MKAWVALVAVVTVSIESAHAHDPFYRDKRLIVRESAMAELSAAYAGVQGADNRMRVTAMAPGIFVIPWLWQRGKTLSGCFWNGTSAVRDNFISIANEWSRYGGLVVSYSTNGQTRVCQPGSTDDVRVSLDTADTRDLWSDAEFSKAIPYGQVGKLQGSPSPKVTLNIPTAELLMQDSPDQFRFLVLHEMGHVWGLLHEHQRGLCDSWYNLGAIEADTGFTQDQVVKAFDSLQSLGFNNLTYSGPYDRLSVMQYNFPPAWFKPGADNPCLRPDTFSLSDGDKAVAAAMYGPPLAGQVVAQVRQQLALLVSNAQSLSAARQKEYLATSDRVELTIQQLGRPRRECIQNDYGHKGPACYDKPIESPEVDAHRETLRQQVKDASGGVKEASDAVASLQRLKKAYDRFQLLQ